MPKVCDTLRFLRAVKEGERLAHHLPDKRIIGPRCLERLDRNGTHFVNPLEMPTPDVVRCQVILKLAGDVEPWDTVADLSERIVFSFASYTPMSHMASVFLTSSVMPTGGNDDGPRSLLDKMLDRSRRRRVRRSRA